MRSAALTLALGLPLLWFGGVTDFGLVAALLTAALFAASVAFSDRRQLPTKAKIAVVALVGLAVAAGAQLIPLPMRLLHLLSPIAEQVWTSADVVVGAAGHGHPLSLDPPATAFASATAAVVATVFLASCAVATLAGGARRVLYVVVGVIIMFDLVALAHPLMGVSEIYGIHPLAVETGSLIVGPLVNPNHIAAVASIGPPLMLGLVMQKSTLGGRIVAGVGAVLSSAVVILTLSRGGMAVLTAELVSVSIFALLRRKGNRSMRSQLVLAGLVLASALGAALYVAMPPVLREASNTDVSKLRVALRSLVMTKEFAWTGVGRGAFGGVFPTYEGEELARASVVSAGNLQYTHAENWPAQLLADLGVPVAALLCLTLAWAAIPALRRALRGGTTFGAAVALLGLVVHDFADFSMEYVGVANLAAVLLSVVLVRESSAEERKSPRPEPTDWRRFVFPGTSLGLVGAAAGFLALGWNHATDVDARNLAALWTQGRLNDSEAAVHAAIARHPAEPFFTMLEGVRHVRDPLGGPLLVRAVHLGPWRAQSHFWLARWFAGAGRQGQALAEYREALRLGPGLARPVLNDLLAIRAPVEDIQGVADTEVAFEQAVALLEKGGRTDDANSLDLVIIERYPPGVAARVRLIRRARARQALVAVHRLADELLTAAPRAPETYLTLAELEPDPVAAESILERGLALVGEDPRLLQALVRSRAIRLGPSAVSSELERLRSALALVNRVYLLHATLAEVERSRGRIGLAVGHYFDAAAAAPDGEPYLLAAAQLADSDHRYELASGIYRRLSAAHPSNTAYLEAVDRLRRELEKQHSPPLLPPTSTAPSLP